MASSAAVSQHAILYVDDEPNNLALFRMQFEELFAIRTAANGEQALACLGGEEIAVVFTDERMPGMTGIELLARVSERWPETLRVIVSAYRDADRLWAALNRGHAQEYLVKPWSAEEITACIQRSLQTYERRRALLRHAEIGEVLTQEQRAIPGTGKLIGAEGGLATTLRLARRAAATDATVLVRGETGTGKALVARFIHDTSSRATFPFIQVNCGALSEGILESELFGHEQGAFTGATRTRKGRFELAEGGTLFLDEIGDISPKLQVNLLRALQEGEFERVGGNATLKVDVRIVAATHRNLEAAVAAGKFREDLYYRLNVIPLEVPPLRDRKSDLVPLLHHFIDKHCPPGRTRPRLAAGVAEALAQYNWPGNVRELENLVQRAVVLASSSELDIDDFSVRFAPCALADRGQAEGSAAEFDVLADIRGQVRDADSVKFRRALVEHGGNLSRAARALGLPRSTLVSRLRRLGLS